jgi:hypothetical protein
VVAVDQVVMWLEIVLALLVVQAVAAVAETLVAQELVVKETQVALLLDLLVEQAEEVLEQ